MPANRHVYRQGGGHDQSEGYFATMKKYTMASDFFGAFYLDRVPRTMGQVPTMEEMRIAYGSHIPAYDMVSQYLPLYIRLTAGAAKLRTIVWPACRVLGIAAVYWDGTGGPNHFRWTLPHGSMLAKWSFGEASEQSVQVPAVYEDPVFSKSTRVTSENMGDHILEDPPDVAPKIGETTERLIDPNDPQKMQDNNAHKYEGQRDPVHHHSTGTSGRWWPVWLVCRTRKGWWCICWYQLLDGTWVTEFWWYADVHVHLIDARL